MNVVNLDSRKTFDTLSHSALLEELAAHGLEEYTVCWVKIWLDGQAQGAVGTGATSSWWSVTAAVLQGNSSGASSA